jgi:monoterpene epsilon-lactone hydrolase
MRRQIFIASGLVLILLILGLVIMDGNVIKPSLTSRLLYSGLVIRESVPRDRSLKEERDYLNRMGRLTEFLLNVDVEPVTAGGVPAEWVCPHDPLDERAIFYLHGGSYTMGSLDSHRGLVGHIALASGMCVLIIDYRLAPEHPFPAALEDAAAAYHWLLEIGVPPENIAIAGDSAGGGLTMATLLSLRDEGIALPALAVLLSPWTDLAGTGESLTTLDQADPMLKWNEGLEINAAYYFGDNDPRSPLISPLYADLHGLPPLLIQVGSNEILLDDATRLADQARQSDVDVTLQVWEGMWHVWHPWAGLVPESQQALDEISAFIRDHLS